MTALRFQTGEGGEIRHPRPPFGGNYTVNRRFFIYCSLADGNGPLLCSSWRHGFQNVQTANNRMGTGFSSSFFFSLGGGRGRCMLNSVHAQTSKSSTSFAFRLRHNIPDVMAQSRPTQNLFARNYLRIQRANSGEPR